MKIIKSFVLILVMAIVVVCMAACGKTPNLSGNETQTDENGQTTTVTIDYDLTSMSATILVVYVNEIVNTKPADYLGKVIKAKGKYAKSANGLYHFIVIEGADACCAQGIEIIYNGTYPPVNSNIELYGTYSKYQEGSNWWYYIDVTSLVVK